MTETVNSEVVESEEISTITAQEFFDNLRRGTYVTVEKLTLATEFVFGGHSWNDDGKQTVSLYNSTGHRTEVGPDALQNENGWVTIKSDDGENKVASDTLLQLMWEMNEHLNRANRLDRELRESRNELAGARVDFDQLNDFLNEYARDQRMCADYERQLDDWNESLTTFKLLGRPQDWSVGIKVGSFDGYIEINARSRELANEIARKLTAREAVEKLINAGYDFDYLEVEITCEA